MRQGQHKQRSRGRGRKVHNPSNRSYDSNGPDVKIRGTAAHIAEKYSTLARDSQVAGDRVASENYLQHAEHYNRIVAAGQAHLQQQQAQQQVPQPVSPPVTNGQDDNGVAEAQAAGSTPEEISDAATETSGTEEEAPKTRTGNLRQRRRRSASGRNGSAARTQTAAADNAETPASKSEEEENSGETAPELDQTAAE